MVNASKIERALVTLDESQDLLVEIEAGVPDQGPIPEDPQHHLAACLFPWEEAEYGKKDARPDKRAGGGEDWI